MFLSTRLQASGSPNIAQKMSPFNCFSASNHYSDDGPRHSRSSRRSRPSFANSPSHKSQSTLSSNRLAQDLHQRGPATASAEVESNTANGAGGPGAPQPPISSSSSSKLRRKSMDPALVRHISTTSNKGRSFEIYRPAAANDNKRWTSPAAVTTDAQTARMSISDPHGFKRVNHSGPLSPEGQDYRRSLPLSPSAAPARSFSLSPAKQIYSSPSGLPARTATTASASARRRKPAPPVTASVIRQAGQEAVVASGGVGSRDTCDKAVVDETRHHATESRAVESGSGSGRQEQSQNRTALEERRGGGAEQREQQLEMGGAQGTVARSTGEGEASRRAAAPAPAGPGYMSATAKGRFDKGMAAIEQALRNMSEGGDDALVAGQKA